MPPKQKPKWEHRPKRGAGISKATLERAPTQAVEAAQPEPALKLSAAERMQLFARLLWLSCYKLLFGAEASAHAAEMAALTAAYTSTHTKRLMGLGTDAGLRACSAVETRLRDCVGFLSRAANRTYVPISQAAKAIAFLASGVAKPVWEAERKVRCVVGRD